jgi:hypothetical protein
MAGNWETLSLAAASRVHPFCNFQSQARTPAVLVIGRLKCEKLTDDGRQVMAKAHIAFGKMS